MGAGPAWLRRHLPEAVAQTLVHYPTLHAHIVGGFEVALLQELRADNLDFTASYDNGN